MTANETIGISDKAIVEGLRGRDSRITRDYFYGYCRMAYHIYEKKYDLRHKLGMDFYTLAHEYYLALDKGNFSQLEDRKPSMSLKTWMINGFRFVLLDRLKQVEKEECMDSLEERVERMQLRFDVPDNDFGRNVRDMIEEIADRYFSRDSRQAIILKMMLIEGFKGKEVAAELGITPSAVTQQYHKMMEKVVIPYFKHNFDTSSVFMSSCMEVAPECTMEELELHSLRECRMATVQQRKAPSDGGLPSYLCRITPPRVVRLDKSEVFVFGSNLAGMHGGGAARTARLHFGAVMGCGDGLQGHSYAIPTMQGGVETIRPYVDKFILFARNHPDMRFLVTRIGCGIAGFDAEDIAPLFRQAMEVENISLPLEFWSELRGDFAFDK